MRQDLAYALRTLRRSPSFTIVALLMLALGIGATSAIFSFVDGVMLRPLPYRDPDSIVRVWERPPQTLRNVISTMNFGDWQSQNTVFTAMAAAGNGSSTLATAAGPVQVRGTRVSASYFDIYGVTAAAGRTFAPGEDTPGRDRVVVISHSLWEQQFDGDPSLVGRAIRLDGVPYTVIGVLPADSPFDRTWAKLWRPLAFTPDEMTRDYHWQLGPDIPWEIVGVVTNEHAGGLGDHDGAGMYVSTDATAPASCCGPPSTRARSGSRYAGQSGASMPIRSSQRRERFLHSKTTTSRPTGCARRSSRHSARSRCCSPPAAFTA
jgi:hypothetical protein